MNSKNMWGKLETAQKSKMPEDILEEQGRYLEELTEHKVHACLQKYDKSMDDIFAALFKGSKGDPGQEDQKWSEPEEELRKRTGPMDRAADLLGEVGAAVTYEFYLYSEALPNYKYRVMYIEHGLNAYPAKLLIEKDVCDEIAISSSLYVCRDEYVFENILAKILGSKRVMEIVSKLKTY